MFIIIILIFIIHTYLPHRHTYSDVLDEPYQILSDPVKRDAYDRNGKGSIYKDTMLDSTAVLMFFSEVRRVHPDKNLNDPQAAERFQVLDEPYQILSDHVKRDAYDRNGKGSICKDTMLDSTAVLMFFSEVGHLKIT
nr:hypothetical protein [Tanacetum cinerariifolium]